MKPLRILIVFGAVAAMIGGGALHATGNLEVITLSGTAIGNRVWHPNSFPVIWLYNDPSTAAGCNYTSASAPAGTLQAAIAAGFNTWQNAPDATITFTYGGTTPVRNVGADGVNVVTFCSNTSFQSGVIASTPTTALTVPVTVTPDVACPSGQGMITSGANSWCFPAGSYPAGTIIDGDIQFNTTNPSNAEASLTTGDPTLSANAARFDVQSVATHEEGHFFGLSHDPILQAVMFPFIDDDPFSDGLGQRVLKTSDLSTASHYYPEPTFGASFGSITGHVTLDGVAADGVHVVAIDPATMLGVAGRFSISRFEDPAAMGGEGPDFASHGAGFYRIDGLPPGDYYVYAEYFDNSEFFTTRLLNRYNTTVGNSNVSNGNTGASGQVGGWLGFIPALAEFFDANESGNGGDGLHPAASDDNADVATLVHVAAGATTPGIDIAINIVPPNGQPPSARQNPTARAVLPNDSFQGSDRITGFLLNGGTDDFYAIRYPASLLPTPPYNVAEGLWVRAGRNTSNYVNRLVFTSPSNPSLPELNNPVLAPAARVLTGGIGGKTAAGDFIDIRDQWNVTINEPRDVWVILNQPAPPAGISFLSQGFFVLVTRTSSNQARVGRTLVTQNGGTTWGTLTADVFYDLITEKAPPVMITGASPTSFEEGRRGDVDITGAGFEPGAAVDMGPGIAVNSVTFVDSDTLRVNVKVADAGAVSARDVSVKVTNPQAVFPNVSRVFRVVPSTNLPPVAVAASISPVECTSPSGAFVTLDGTGSNDADSTSGTNDDIVSFEWFEDFGLPSQTLLGTGSTLGVQMALGSHAVTLRVTDTHDATDTATLQVVVQDTTPPVIATSIEPQTLWPPNHVMVGIDATVVTSDLCGPAAVTLASASSSEPDDAPGGGDGSTTGDIQGADLGTADLNFDLRAERLGTGSGRVYTIVYTASDGSGNQASASAAATVPHSQNGVVEPLILSVRETASGTVVEWQPVAGALYYNVIRGRLENLRDAGTAYDLGPVTCIAGVSLDPSTAGHEDALVPDPDRAFFYLAEYSDGWRRSYGTEEILKPAVPAQGACQ